MSYATPGHKRAFPAATLERGQFWGEAKSGLNGDWEGEPDWGIRRRRGRLPPVGDSGTKPIPSAPPPIGFVPPIQNTRRGLVLTPAEPAARYFDRSRPDLGSELKRNGSNALNDILISDL